jgi:hypothetical protein
MKDIIRAARSIDFDDIAAGLCFGLFVAALMFSPLFVG